MLKTLLTKKKKKKKRRRKELDSFINMRNNILQANNDLLNLKKSL